MTVFSARIRARPGLQTLFAAVVTLGLSAWTPGFAQVSEPQDLETDFGDEGDLEPDTFFEDLPTADLVEMHAVIGRELMQRGVFDEAPTPTQQYAAWLLRTSFDLAPSGPSLATDDAGARYLVLGAREPEHLTLSVDVGGADQIAVVLFTDDHRVRRAGIAPSAAVASLLDGGALTAASSARLWRLDDLRDITPQIYATATQFDIGQ